MKDVGIDLGGFDVLVTKKLLDGADIITGFEEMGGEGVTERVATGGLGDAAGFDGGVDRALEVGVVGVVAAGEAGARVEAEFGGGKDILPAPFFIGVGIFTLEGVGEVNGAIAGLEIGLVEGFDAAEMIA